MNHAIAPALASYQRTLNLARAAHDTVVLETHGDDGIISRTLDPARITIEPSSGTMRLLDDDGHIADISFDAPILPSITRSKIREQMTAAKTAIGQLADTSSHLRLTYEGTDSMIEAAGILVDAFGIWLPNGGGFEWADYAWMTYCAKGETGDNPTLTIATISPHRIILKA